MYNKLINETHNFKDHIVIVYNIVNLPPIFKILAGCDPGNPWHLA